MKKSYVKEDRISALPDGVIQHILSFVDMKVVVKSSILSKRWRYLWGFTPNLNFYLGMCKTKKKQKSFIRFVNQVLIHYNLSNINKFSLVCKDYFDADCVYEWVIVALKRNVQEVHLELVVALPMELSHHLFTSNIKVLKLVRTGVFQMKLPNSMCTTARINSLELESFQFPDGNSDGELSLSCVNLENLIIRNGDISHLNALTISAPLLERLELSHLHVKRNASCKINICSPKLKSFKCTGFLHCDYSINNLSALVSAHIDIKKIVRMTKEVYAEYLIKILRGVRNVNGLALSTLLIKSLADCPNILEWLPDQFHNLRYMKLTEWWVDDTSICATGKLLERLPHIEALVWERSESMLSGSDKRDLGEALSSQCEFHGLKTIEIRNSQGFEDELKLLEFLLKRAMTLKEIKITTTEKSVKDRKKKIIDFREKLLSLPRASSNVLISFSLRV